LTGFDSVCPAFAKSATARQAGFDQKPIEEKKFDVLVFSGPKWRDFGLV
jgi:hypothetical protein